MELHNQNRVLPMGESIGSAVNFLSPTTSQSVRVPRQLLELVLEGVLEVDDIPNRDLVFRTLLHHWMSSAGFLPVEDE